MSLRSSCFAAVLGLALASHAHAQGLVYEVLVTPDFEPTPTRKANSGPYTATFNVEQIFYEPAPGLPNLYVVTCTGSGGVTCTATNPTTVPLSGNQTATVTVTYTVGAAGNGFLFLSVSDGTAGDNGSYTVPIASFSVAVTPDFGFAPLRAPNTTGFSQVFTVRNSGTGADTYTLSCGATGAIYCGLPSPFTLTLPGGASGSVTVGYATGNGTGGRLRLFAASESASDSGWYTINVATYTVSVAPDDRTVLVPQLATNWLQAFTIRHTGNATATYTLDVLCTGAAVLDCGTPPPVTLGSGAVAGVSVSYRAGDANTVGRIRLLATQNADPTVQDSGWVTVKAYGDSPLVEVASANPGSTVERDLCVTVSLSGGTAYECGDLRVAHPLPATRTLNKARIPTLLYNSQHAQPDPLVAANVTAPPGLAVPDSIVAVLRLGGVERARGRWPGTQWLPGATRRVVVGFEDSTIATGIHAYTLEVTSWIGATPKNALAASGELVVVNRRKSPFGAGWWLAGLERLLPGAQTSLIWVGGDGSVRRYVHLGNLVWAAPAVDRPDTVVFDFQTWGFERRLPHGVRVRFNSQGRHVATVNRLGHRTTFEYVGLTDTLRRISLPPAAAGKTYEFAYVDGVLSTVTAPPVGAGPRVTQVYASAGRVDSIRDPDLTTVRFTYAPGGARLMGRTDRLGTPLTFAFDPGGRLASATLDMGAQPALVTMVRSLESFGFTTAVDTARAYTRVDGPRTDVADTTAFWLDRFGAPRRIVNARGLQTLITRGDPRWPALPTELRAANGFVTRATYDARGNLAMRTAVNPLGDGRNAVARHHWDPRWDFADSVISATGLVRTFGYDPASGNRLWEQVGPNPARRISFRYGNTLGLLSSTELPGTPADSIEYDVAGNLAATRSARGHWTLFYKDGAGADTLVLTPIDSADRTRDVMSFGRLRVRTASDLSGRDTLSETAGPALSGAPQQTLTVRQSFDAEGRRLSLARQSSAPDLGIGAITTTWRYDRAGRPVVEVAPDGAVDSTVYDPAGNPVRAITRRGDTITTSYDALSRQVWRVLPAVSYGQRVEGIAALTPNPFPDINTPYPRHPNDGAGGYLVPRDSAAFAYDAIGNVTQADNGDARVRRTYYPNGSLATETQILRTVAPINAGGSWDLHTYRLTYRYDLDGRRVALKYPAQLAPPGADSAAFAYDPETGALAQVWDPLGNGFRYHYNARGELDTLSLPNGVFDARAYDDDGSLLRHDVSGARRQTAFLTDARGKVLRSANTHGIRDTLTAAYSGLGHLVTSAHVAWGTSVLGHELREATTDQMAHDALGNAEFSISARQVTGGGAGEIQRSARDWAYFAGTGRLGAGVSRPAGVFDSLRYDPAGNVVFSWQPAWVATAPQLEDRASYYAADGTLRAADYRVKDEPLQQFLTPLKMTFEEYRYDALGRRVGVRARRDCGNLGVGYNAKFCKYISFVRRTVWDGSQELAEIQMPGREGITADTLENDTAPIQLRVSDEFEGREDANPHFGRVLFTYGGIVDQPLSMVRVHYASAPFGRSWALWEPVSIVPLWSTLGEADGGDFATGAARCRTLDGEERCVKVEWPISWNAQLRATFVPDYWQGTLIEGKRDKAGTLYRRNRVYDPATGRFTQEDPIGLAGGLNLYGFADGDPVNYGDPFGLCPYVITGKPCPGLLAVGVGFVPIAGDAIDIIGAAVGRDLLTGEEIGGLGIAATIVGTVLGSGRLGREALKVPAKAKKWITVLGKYDGPEGGYVDLAHRLGGNLFNIDPADWARMTPRQRWAWNKSFLDDVARRGDDIVLNVPIDSIDPKSTLGKELRYLMDKWGYEVVDRYTLRRR
ncbi:MAG: RHS repeat-associated core domain-containing protein [Gemmatimonadales bacterium]